MQHRLILLVPNPDNFDSLDDFHQHWNVRHADYVLPVPHVVGYVQNRPVDRAWHWERFHACAELFFDSADGERQAWDSEPWRTGLAPDESYLLDIERGWSSVVQSTVRVRMGFTEGLRVLAFGGDPDKIPDGGGAVSILQLEDTPPIPGGRGRVLSVFTTDRAEADAVAAAVGGVALVADAARIIDPPDWP
ncbi:EthD domain-containing protein [Rhodococcus koreensis]